MRHFLAYGNSDQVSFRSPIVKSSFDYMTVPGTIASYYSDATAAFVLSSNLSYVVDPRTPLFQGAIDLPKKSHYSLAEWHGSAIKKLMGDSARRLPVKFQARDFTDDVIAEMVKSIVRQQRAYGDRAKNIQQQLDRYQRMFELARGVEPQPTVAEGKRPSFVLLPYFVTDGRDEWRAVNLQIRAHAQELERPDELSAVVAVKSADALNQILAELPAGLSRTTFFWIDRFDEREHPIESLSALAETVAAHSDRLSLINLYGGFFSILLSYKGLWGFSNGLGYSESRDWPELPATGAAPARYYLRRLHCYVSPGLGEHIMRNVPALACPCEICQGRAIIALTYHQLKQHFALARKWEIELVAERTPAEVADEMDEARRLYRVDVAPTLPSGLGRVNPDYLQRWSAILRAI
jgi:hypothetical protein